MKFRFVAIGLGVAVLLTAGCFVQKDDTAYLQERGAAVPAYSADDLSRAVLENDQDLAERIIISHMVNINSRDKAGRYPLEMALPMQNTAMARLLLEAGADPHVITGEGVSVYELVMKDGTAAMRDLFQRFGKDKKPRG